MHWFSTLSGGLVHLIPERIQTDCFSFLGGIYLKRHGKDHDMNLERGEENLDGR